jgi:LPS-assembly lipoprotein
MARTLTASRRRWMTTGLAALAAAALGGCGFKLRQAPVFAFQTLVAPLPDASPLRRELRQALVAVGLQVFDAPPPTGADAVLEVLADQREKSVVGSTAAGQVREFQIRTRFRFKLSTPKGKVLIDDSEILLQRDISYSETLALSKVDEEAQLYRDMQTDIVQQVLRRLAAVRSL